MYNLGLTPSSAVSSYLVFEPKKSSFLFRSGIILYRYSVSNNAVKEVANLGSSFPFCYMDYDPKANKLFVASLWEGKLFVYNLKKQKKEGEVYLEPFIRYLTYDPKRNVVYVAGHWRGNLYAVDVKTKHVVGKTYIGRRSHWLYLSRDGNRLYVATAVGVLAVELNKFVR